MAQKSFFKKYPRVSLVLVNLFFLAVIFFIFEVAIRMFSPSWLQFRMKALNTGDHKDFGSDASWKVLKKDGQFYSFEPNSTFKMYAFEYENEVHINKLGARSNGNSDNADTSKLIPFTGDSFVFGVGVEDENSTVALARRATGLNLVNLGVTGTGMHFQRKMIEKRYKELGKPKKVVYGFFLGNDFADIITEQMKDNDTPKEVEKSVAATVSNTAAPSSNTLLWKVNYFVNQNFLLKRSYALQYIKEKLLALKNKGEAKVIKPVFYVMDRQNKDYLAMATKALDKEVQALAAQPYKSIVVIYPDRKQVYDQLRKDVGAYYGVEESNMDPTLPNRLLRSALEKYRIPYIDGTNCLLQHRNDGALYYTQDNHLTPLGQRVFTACIAPSLLQLLKD